MRNAGLDEIQAGIKIAGRSINKLTYADDTTLMAESEEELKSLLMKVKGYPHQYSGLENSMDSIVHGVTKSQTGLSNFHFSDMEIIPL